MSLFVYVSCAVIPYELMWCDEAAQVTTNQRQSWKAQFKLQTTIATANYEGF